MNGKCLWSDSMMALSLYLEMEGELMLAWWESVDGSLSGVAQVIARKDSDCFV